MKRFAPYLTPLTLAAMPLLVGAQTVDTALSTIFRILNTIIPILMVIATIAFLWGVIKFVLGQDAEDKSKGRQFMIYGIIGLAAMVSVWGIVRLLVNTFGVGGAGVPPGPGQF
ncbi:MAG: hypothetical protein COU68_05255 [Candidatus Pacebacteria bacterium CG10_big_fil_rev_8_21_14_0_10_45_6]|nr:MAG: hypothetical protein COU68_05255 [Candidatus Pacebacteria bacterium CG10_big_fil_rev_8_21_14_0_10_45_6]